MLRKERAGAGEKQNPREVVGLPAPAAASHGVAPWGGWGGSQRRLRSAPSSPSRPVGDRTEKQPGPRLLHPCGTHEQNKSLWRRREDAAIPPHPVGLSTPPAAALQALQTQPCHGKATRPRLPPPREGPRPRWWDMPIGQDLHCAEGFITPGRSSGGDAMCSAGLDGISGGFCHGRWVRRNPARLLSRTAFPSIAGGLR